MTESPASTPANGTAMERAVPPDISQVLIQGDLSQLTPEQKAAYYMRVCESLRLNPYTQPFGYIQVQGGLKLYALKNATDQLRDIHKVSIYQLDRVQTAELCMVTAYARLPDGRTDSSIGAVNVKNLTGENLANAMMRAETKAKRRVTLSIVGLGWTDETEVSSIRDATVYDVTPQLTPGPGFIPTDERDVDDAPRPASPGRDVKQGVKPADRIVSDPEERIWKRWLEVRDEAVQVLGDNPTIPTLTLPMAYTQLVDTALAVQRKTADKVAELDRIQSEARIGDDNE